MNFRQEDPVFSFDNPARTQQQLLWQSLTPEMRTEAMRRIQLIHMLRQVNPDLQLCRRNGGLNNTTANASVPAKVTADKAVQVPDIRFEFLNQRRSNNNSNNNNSNSSRKWATFNAPGVRINPRQSDFQNRTLTDYNNRAPTRPKEQRVAFKPPDPNNPILDSNASESTIQKRPSKRIEIKSPDSVTVDEQVITKRKENMPPVAVPKEQKKPEDEHPNLKKLELNETIEVTILTMHDYDKDKRKDEEPKTERQVLIKQKEASSGEEDSVVVVLNQPRTEQGLERKYGQFYCRRCMRGWSSRSVWCVRHTSKVYIKQTCNICNKLVNPYLVSHLPPASNTSKQEAAKEEATEEDKEE